MEQHFPRSIQVDKSKTNSITDYMKEQDVSFVRLAFCDIFGQLKNVSISVNSLKDVLNEGLTFNVAAVRGLLNVEEGDLRLVPDPDTLSILPWRPSEGKVARFFCQIRYADGRPFEGDVRHILKQYQDKLAKENTDLQIRSECEFYLFKQDDEGNPTDTPMDRASYFEVAPIDKGENIRREICLTMERMGIPYGASHHEKGPGQNEVRFTSLPMIDAADNLIAFKDIVKVTAARMGLFASFLPKPLFSENESALSISITCRSASDRKKTAMEMAGGILRRIEEITLFLNPIANSYERSVPARMNYGYGNQRLLIKVHPEEGRVKVRLADPSCNPYLVYLLLSGAAMEGLRDHVNPDEFNTGRELPDTMIDAIRAAEKSRFVKSMIPGILFERFLQAKRDDWEESSLSGDPMLKAKNMEFPVT